MRRALVVGHTRGIGAAIAEFLWNRGGWDVTGLSRTGTPPLDLRWPEEQIAAVVGPLVEGELDALVLSGGMGAYLAPWQMKEERVRELFAVNFFGPLAVYRACVKPLLKAKGRVLWIGSTASRKPGATGLSVYAATKGAVDSFVYSEARRMAKAGVAINVLAAGWVDTDMTADLKPELRERIVKSIPFGRMAKPEEIAVFATSIIEAPNFLTGEVLHMAGGA